MKLILSAIAFSTLAVSAYAADLPRRAQPAKSILAPTPVATWEGFYAGGHLGYNASSNLSPSLGGLFGGVQAGYDWQVNNVVFGVAGDLSRANIRGSNGLSSSAETVKGSLRGRLGYAFSPQLLGYSTVGFGFGNVKSVVYAPAATTDRSTNGAVAGLGLEYKFDKNWSTFGEYRRHNVKGDSINFNSNDFRLGVNYRF